MTGDNQHGITRRRYGKGTAGTLGTLLSIPGTASVFRTSNSSRQTETAQTETPANTPQETATETASESGCNPDESPSVSPDELPPEFADIHDDLKYALDQAITDYNSTHGSWENPHLNDGLVEWEFSKPFSGDGKSDHYMLDLIVTTNPDGKYDDITAHAGHQERDAMIDELGDFYSNVIANTVPHLDGFNEESQTTDEPVIQDVQYIVDGADGGKMVATAYPPYIDSLAEELRNRPAAEREAYVEKNMISPKISITPPDPDPPC